MGIDSRGRIDDTLERINSLGARGGIESSVSNVLNHGSNLPLPIPVDGIVVGHSFCDGGGGLIPPAVIVSPECPRVL